MSSPPQSPRHCPCTSPDPGNTCLGELKIVLKRLKVGYTDICLRVLRIAGADPACLDMQEGMDEETMARAISVDQEEKQPGLLSRAFAPGSGFARAVSLHNLLDIQHLDALPEMVCTLHGPLMGVPENISLAASMMTLVSVWPRWGLGHLLISPSSDSSTAQVLKRVPVPTLQCLCSDNLSGQWECVHGCRRHCRIRTMRCSCSRPRCGTACWRPPTNRRRAWAAPPPARSTSRATGQASDSPSQH